MIITLVDNTAVFHVFGAASPAGYATFGHAPYRSTLSRLTTAPASSYALCKSPVSPRRDQNLAFRRNRLFTCSEVQRFFCFICRQCSDSSNCNALHSGSSPRLGQLHFCSMSQRAKHVPRQRKPWKACNAKQHDLWCCSKCVHSRVRAASLWHCRPW